MTVETQTSQRAHVTTSATAYINQGVRQGWRALREAASTTAGRLFAFFACLYILTYKGSLTAVDGMMMYQTTRSLVDRGSLAIPHSSSSVVGRGGLDYSFYGLGTSLVEMPFYLVGKLLAHLSHSKADQIAIAITELSFPLIAALSCVAFYALARVLGYPRRTAVLATLALGLLTSIWVYSKLDFSEPLLTLSLTVAVVCAFALARSTDERETQRYALLTGVALGWAMLAKYLAVGVVPLFCLYVLWTMPGPRTLARVVRLQALLLAGVAVSGFLTLLVNDVRFGSPLTTGYPPGGRLFTIPVYEGAWGLLLSTFRGLLWYDPLLFAGLLLLPLLAWRRPREGVLPLALVLFTLVIYGGFVDWPGGGGFGPRYLLQMMPLLLLPLMALGWLGPVGDRAPLLPRRVADWLHARGTRLRVVGRSGLSVLVAVSLFVTLLGVLSNMYIYDVYMFPDSHVAPLAASPIAVALWALPMSLHYAFTRGFPTGYSAADFPWGPPLPQAPHMPQALGEFFAQSFWFTLSPRPLLALLVGGAVLGLGIFLSGRALWPLLRGAQHERLPVDP